MILRILLFFLLLSPTFLIAQTSKNEFKQPKLIVGVVVDQMRYDYLSRYWGKYSEDGFKKLINQGFNCKNTHYNYIPTFTGPGHASIFTGATPSMHGIIGNNWYDRNLSRSIYCIEDLESTKQGQSLMSPKNMLSTTITDELRLFSNWRSKVIGIALKDRSAIFPAGHSANAAYWLDKSNGFWTTSKYYMNELPIWVKTFNEKKIGAKYLSQTWETLYPIETYTESASDDNPYESSFDKTSRPIFPYKLQELIKKEGPGLIISTPFGNDYTKDFAIETIKSEGLGKGDFADFLTISFSSPDYIGHQFGPQSIEVEDNYLRLDKTLAELIQFLEDHIGNENFLLFLTADHGASNNPSYLKDNKIPAGHFDSGTMISSLKNFLNNTYGNGDWVLNYSNEQIFLNRKLIEEKKIDLDKIQDHSAEFILQFIGVANTFPAHTIHKNTFHGKPRELIQNGYNQKRSGDVILVLEPGWMEYSKTGTTHGTVYSYDTHVPLIWYGWKIKHGTSAENIFITDIAATLATILNISIPNGCIGKSFEDLIIKK